MSSDFVFLFCAEIGSPVVETGAEITGVLLPTPATIALEII